MDSSRRAGLIAESPGRVRGMERVPKGQEQLGPSSLQKHPLGGGEKPGGAALGLAGRQEADDWSGPVLALASSLFSSLSKLLPEQA